jgi:hypothetical protein
VRDALTALGTPAHSFFNEEVFDGRPHDIDACRVQQAFTLLTLLADPEDVVSLRCWCGFGNSSLRAGGWHRLRQHCVRTGMAPHEVLAQIAEGKLSIAYTSDLGVRYRALQSRLVELKDVRGQDLIDALFPEDELWAEAFRRAPAEDDDEEPIGPQELLEDLRTRVIQPELPTDVEYIRIMSLHKSKGLTADMVVILGCIRGMIPAAIPEDLTPQAQQGFIEEQRRLFFVALTRTRKILILSDFARIPRDLAHRTRVPIRSGGTADEALTYASAFLGELGRSRPRTMTAEEFLESMDIEIDDFGD